MSERRFVGIGLAVVSVIVAIVHARRALGWNDELAIESPFSNVAPVIDDPGSPRLAGRVVLVIVDGLRADETRGPCIDSLRRRGVDLVAHVPYPTVSRPNYVTILTGVVPRDSGVRGNHVVDPVTVDTVMDRVQAAGLHVAVATDFAVLVSLFLRHTKTIDHVAYFEHGTVVTPPPPLTWPADEVRRLPSLEALGPAIAELARGDAAFLAVHVIDVDRAGHAYGVGDEYRAAAAAVDRMLCVAFERVDLARDVVIVTADHGHVASGGHGGTEPEVATVALVMAGKGIVAGRTARDARLDDVAPTVAALLGVPSPGHAEGRTLVELLALTPDEARRRTAADEARSRVLANVVAAAHAVETRPSPVRLALAGLGLAVSVAFAWLLRRRESLALPGVRGAIVAALPSLITLATALAITRGRMSPSYVPSLARVEQLGVVGLIASIVVPGIAAWWVLRRSPRMANANGLAWCGLAGSLLAVAVARAWFSPPHVDVPSPTWMVLVPTLEVAAAASAGAVLLTLLIGAVLARNE